jgi:hypothetical protein
LFILDRKSAKDFLEILPRGYFITKPSKGEGEKFCEMATHFHRFFVLLIILDSSILGHSDALDETWEQLDDESLLISVAIDDLPEE